MSGWLRVLLLVLTGVLILTVGLVLWGSHEHWDTPTAVGVAALAVSLVGLSVAVGGFTVAILEIRKAASVAEATSDAVKRTLRGVAAIELIGMIEQLRQAVIDLEEADNPAGVRLAIRTWRTVGSDAKGPLERRFGAELPALETLDTSIESARTTIAALRKSSESADEVTPACLEAMERAVDQLGPLREQLLPTMEELDEHA